MLEKEITYIYSIEGKDLYKKTMEVKESKKFKAALDYSLEAIQIEKVAQAVYKGKKEKQNIFYQEEGKQYTNKIVNVTFKYNEKEYNLISIKDKKYYVHLNSNLDNKKIKDLIFDNGIYKDNNIIQAIEIGAETELKGKQLPQGFGVKDGKIYLTSTGIKTIANSDEIRKELYENGFKIKYSEKQTVEYVRFKRSSGSSRVGKCLFIDKRLYKDMLEWSMMGLMFNETDKIDLAALEAYISLTTSSIIDTIEIKPENILLIDDYKSTFTDMVMVTEIKKEKYIDENGEEKERDRLHTEPRKTNITNSIWDGESLGDESLFGEKYKDKGFLLLRNQFLKTACFKTKIQKFFKDNNITEISQLNGFTLAAKVEDIKLITTPSSIKYLKFGTKESYLKLLNTTFGIVKYDKPTHYFGGKMVQTHYQLLNTLQLNEEETRELLKDSLDYVRLLKNDIRVFRDHLHIKIKDGIEYGEMNSTNEFMMTMLQLNNKFENTDLFNTFRQDSIKSYIKNMKKGHILIHGNYSVLCGNGLEMLKYSCKDKNGDSLFNGKSLLDKDEVYCKNFKFNKELIGSRSPHVTMGNIWLARNTNKEKAEKISKYFNSSRQIVHINSIGTNILERLSSADFDSDQLLLSDNELLISKAKLNYDKFLVPTSMVEAKKVKRLNTAEEKCDLDIKTSKNLIGDIINCSQILNSKLWDYIWRHIKFSDIDVKYIEKLYAIISQLDVMSCIEIDKAKKEFSIDNQLELDDIKEKFINKSKKPMFFKFLYKEKGNKIKKEKFEKHKTTMDFLIEIIDKEMRTIRQKYRKGDNKVTTFGEIFSKENKISLSGVPKNKINKLFKKTKQHKKAMGKIWSDKDMNSSEKYNESLLLKKDYLKFVAELKLSTPEIKKVIYNLNNESKKIKDNIEIRTELNKSDRNLLSSLYSVYKDKFIELFEETREPIEIIKKVKTIDKDKEYIKIYSMNYIIEKII